MDIHNSIMVIQNSIMDIHNSICMLFKKDGSSFNMRIATHNAIKDIHD